MSRLLMTLLLYQNGYMVGKYIPLEAKIANNKDLYYDALAAAQNGWREGQEDAVPFIKYLLSTVIAAYRDFEERMELVSDKLPALETVRKTMQTRLGIFTKAESCGLCPSLSARSVEVFLRKLATNGAIVKQGAGRSAVYIQAK